MPPPSCASHLALALAVLSSAAADEALITTPLGQVQGFVLSDGSGRLFEGVRYAAPPARWEHSVAVSAWAPAVYDATREQAGCVQLCYNDEPPHICPARVSEDCLFANIWTPRLPADGSTPTWPVVLFLHGGNFHDGYTGGLDSDGGLLYDGREFANTTGTVVVIINYRLGALGFLYLGEEAKGDGTRVSGNFGLEDQVTAMAFVKRNIAGFGGDPTRVTLMGQSAGAMSISAHMSRGATAGLYNGAVMMSNPFGEDYRNRDSALGIAGAFTNFSGCGQLVITNASAAEQCLRGKDVATLLAAQMQAEVYILADLACILQVVVAWSPTIGTPYLPLRPLEAFQSGQVLDVPYMIGTTSNETVIFVYEALNLSPGVYIPLSQLEYELLAAALIGVDFAVQSTSIYPYPTPLPDDFKIFASRLLTDGLFLCPTRNASEALQAAQPFRRSKAYHWRYSHLLAQSPALWQSNFTECDDMVCHGSDLPEFFHPHQPSLANFTAEEDALAITMMRYVASFAATGAPGDGGIGLEWPAYEAASRQTLNYETAAMGGVTIMPRVHDMECGWWDLGPGYSVW